MKILVDVDNNSDADLHVLRSSVTTWKERERETSTCGINHAYPLTLGIFSLSHFRRFAGSLNAGSYPHPHLLPSGFSIDDRAVLKYCEVIK